MPPPYAQPVCVQALGLVNGSQGSMQSMFDLLGYVLGLVFNRPDDFAILAWISFLFVFIAALLYR